MVMNLLSGLGRPKACRDAHVRRTKLMIRRDEAGGEEPRFVVGKVKRGECKGVESDATPLSMPCDTQDTVQDGTPTWLPHPSPAFEVTVPRPRCEHGGFS